MMKHFVYQSPLGMLSCLLCNGQLVELRFGEFSGAAPSCRETEALSRELDQYFSGNLTAGFKQEVRFLSGFAFDQAVWRSLCEIPYGQTRSYQWIADRLGKPKAARAVGQAVARNPIPIIIPCHRVIRSDGSLGGFSAGLAIKRWLLKHEKAL